MTLDYSIKRVDKPTGDPLRRKLWRGCRLAAGYSSFTFLEGLFVTFNPERRKAPTLDENGIY